GRPRGPLLELTARCSLVVARPAMRSLGGLAGGISAAARAARVARPAGRRALQLPATTLQLFPGGCGAIRRYRERLAHALSALSLVAAVCDGDHQGQQIHVPQNSSAYRKRPIGRGEPAL